LRARGTKDDIGHYRRAPKRASYFFYFPTISVERLNLLFVHYDVL
jgi:hypothetical protein